MLAPRTTPVPITGTRTSATAGPRINTPAVKANAGNERRTSHSPSWSTNLVGATVTALFQIGFEIFFAQSNAILHNDFRMGEGRVDLPLAFRTIDQLRDWRRPALTGTTWKEASSLVQVWGAVQSGTGTSPGSVA